MVVIVLGFHKSGTTLVARTLHHAGINMGVQCEGEYPQCKYEDHRVQQIKKHILYGGENRKSYQLPWTYTYQKRAIYDYVVLRDSEGNEHWGFKVPDITLCYRMWQPMLPEHMVIGVRRNLDGVLAHYERHSHPPDPGVVSVAWHIYNTMLESYGCPIIQHEDVLKYGPSVISDALGISIQLPDMRR